ncbi:MAG: DNA gyrase subunit A, partial [Bacteroidetes bacterium]|nr:DNA gyrase subunit A [Bacteroidota bacterium]
SNKDIAIQTLMTHIKATDCPTGGISYGMEGDRSVYETGRGRVVMRGRAEFETTSTGKEMIVVTEVPYMVSPSQIIVKAVDLVNEKVIDGISGIRDESGRQGMRIVFDLKRDAIPNVVLNQLYKYTALQSSFSINNIALVNGRPEVLNLKSLIKHFVEHRHEVVTRRTEFLLDEAQKRAHILEGLLIALDNLDAVIKLIRESKNPNDAKDGLMANFNLSEIQAKAILDMRLQRLTGLERDKIREEYKEIMELINYYNEVLASFELRMKIIKDELLEVKEKFNDKRRSEIVLSADDISIEDLIPDENVVVTISHMGYVKRTTLDEYREQNRGGRGNRGVIHRDEDFVEHLMISSTHNYILFFTEQGRCFWLKVYEIPEGGKATKGRPIQNLIQIPSDDKVKAFINVRNLDDKEYTENNYVILCTKKGIIKKTSLEAYSRPRANGINAITVREGDELLEGKLTNGTCEVVLAKKSGRAIRFNESLVRPMGRTASGVKGITLESAKDEVVGMVCVDTKSDIDTTILVVSENGYGKRTDLDDYRITGRGGKGVKTLNITDKTGDLIAIKSVEEKDGLMIINRSGMTIRIRVSDMRVMGRATQGVRLINIKNSDSIASVARIKYDPDAEEDEIVNDTENNINETDIKDNSENFTEENSEDNTEE